MKILSALQNLFAAKPTRVLRSIDDYKQEALLRQGKLQFEKLMKKGLSIPVALL